MAQRPVTEPNWQPLDPSYDTSLFASGGPFARTVSPVLLLGANDDVLAANEPGQEFARLFNGGAPSELHTGIETARSGNTAKVNPLHVSPGHGDGLDNRAFDVTLLPWRSGEVVLLLARDITVERERWKELSEGHRRYRVLIALAPDEFAWETDAEGRFVFVSAQGGLGYAAHDLQGMAAEELAEDWTTARHAFLAVEAQRDLATTLRTADGGTAQVCLHAVPVRDEEGRWRGARGICRDITRAVAQAHALERARHREKLLTDILRITRENSAPQATLDCAAAGLLPALGADGAAVYRLAEDGHERLASAGAPPPEGAVTRVLERLEAGDHAVEIADTDAQVMAMATTSRRAVNGAFCLWHHDGHAERLADNRELAAELAAQLGGAIQQIVRERELMRISETDPLTGLANRRAFFEALRQRLSSLRHPGALLYLDLDHLEIANDLRGHADGDQILTAFARLLQAQTRHDDIAARIGGDEFVLYLDDIMKESVVRRAEALVRTAGEALSGESGDPAHPLGVSIGVATTDPARPESVEDLLARADAAMYRAKQAGKGRVVVADPPA